MLARQGLNTVQAAKMPAAHFWTGWKVLIGPRQKGHKGLVRPLAHIW